MVRNEAEEKSDAQYSEHERSTGCSSPHTLGQRSKKMKNSRISSTRRHPAIRTSCVGPMGLVLKLGLVKTQGVMYCSIAYIEYEGRRQSYESNIRFYSNIVCTKHRIVAIEAYEGIVPIC